MRGTTGRLPAYMVQGRQKPMDYGAIELRKERAEKRIVKVERNLSSAIRRGDIPRVEHWASELLKLREIVNS